MSYDLLETRKDILKDPEIFYSRAIGKAVTVDEDGTLREMNAPRFGAWLPEAFPETENEEVTTTVKNRLFNGLVPELPRLSYVLEQPLPVAMTERGIHHSRAGYYHAGTESLGIQMREMYGEIMMPGEARRVLSGVLGKIKFAKEAGPYAFVTFLMALYAGLLVKARPPLFCFTDPIATMLRSDLARSVIAALWGEAYRSPWEVSVKSLDAAALRAFPVLYFESPGALSLRELPSFLDSFSWVFRKPRSTELLTHRLRTVCVCSADESIRLLPDIGSRSLFISLAPEQESFEGLIDEDVMEALRSLLTFLDLETSDWRVCYKKVAMFVIDGK